MKKNMNRLCILVLIFTVFVISSCASSPSKFTYDADAISLKLKSSEDLNLYEDKAHTLLMCVYQLKDPNSFKQMAEEDAGITKLLGCSRFDQSVISSKRLVIQPNEEMTKSLDRAEGTKYVGIVAGYYNMNKQNMVRLEEIPLGFMTKNPKDLKLRLMLGPNGIQKDEEK